MTKQTAKEIAQLLAGIFPDKPALKFSSAYELLIAVVLSAQCTDERVNKVTEQLFKEHNTPQKMLSLTPEQLEKFIFSCGLYHSKAEHILSLSKDLMEKFNGQVPKTLEELRSLAGVGRKTANVVYSVAFNGDAIAVDTHVFRVANRIGLTKADNPLNTEKGLMKILDKNLWSKMHHYLIYLGRSFCKAGKPDCQNCPIKEKCEKKIKR
ncbi:MAG: endonuclease III [Clostridia bacterium]|nr:endonuclease III [Clostridia bacterium]